MILEFNLGSHLSGEDDGVRLEGRVINQGSRHSWPWGVAVVMSIVIDYQKRSIL